MASGILRTWDYKHLQETQTQVNAAAQLSHAIKATGDVSPSDAEVSVNGLLPPFPKYTQ